VVGTLPRRADWDWWLSDCRGSSGWQRMARMAAESGKGLKHVQGRYGRLPPGREAVPGRGTTARSGKYKGQDRKRRDGWVRRGRCGGVSR
jgi:hypothetical protein